MHSLVLRRASTLAAKPITSVSLSPPPAAAVAELDPCSFRRCRLSRAPTPPQSQVIIENWFYSVQPLIPKFSAAAAEVSSILESRIAGTSLGGDVQETGRVLSEHTSCELFKQCFLIISQRLVTVSRVFMVSSHFTAVVARIAHMLYFHSHRASECTGYVYLYILYAHLLTLSLQPVRLHYTSSLCRLLGTD
jgi:hypothetical protein